VVAVPTAVGRLAVGPRRFHPPPACSAVQQAASRYRPRAGHSGSATGSGPRLAVIAWAAMKSASVISAAWAGLAEITHPSGRFHFYTGLWPRAMSAGGSTSLVSVRCRLHTRRPV
jgi:hypothetical protein